MRYKYWIVLGMAAVLMFAAGLLWAQSQEGGKPAAPVAAGTASCSSRNFA
jgi:hypothetical protein